MLPKLFLLYFFLCRSRFWFCLCSSWFQFMVLVPTELTEYTEAYGLKLLESTERIDATRHTTEITEMIAYIP